MSQKSNILKGHQVRMEILDASTVLRDLVAATMGPGGVGVLLNDNGDTTITTDGVTVAQRASSQNHHHNVLIKLMSEAAVKTNDAAGDGTTTATVLSHAIIREATRVISSGNNRWEVKRGIEAATAHLTKELEKLAIECKDPKTIERVGTVSANGDQTIGKLIAEAMGEVGLNGVITAESGSTPTTELSVVKGMQFDRGAISMYFMTNQKTMEAELENPLLLIVDKKISNIRDMVPLLESVAKAGRPLLIIAEDVEGEALSTLVINNMRGYVKVCAVKAPGFGDRRKEMLEDIAVLTGAQVIKEEIGLTLEQATMDHLGSAKRIVVGKDNTMIVDGAGRQELLAERIESLKSQVADKDLSDYDREKVQERLAKLSGGVAVIQVGAATEAEMKANKAIVEDALNATKAAVEEGVVPGGGVALVRVAASLDKLKGASHDQQMGIDAVKTAMYEPLRQIVANAGEDASVVLNKVVEGKKSFGFNAATFEYGDMVEMGIIDPAKVTRTALQNAASIAGMMITTECMVIEQPKEDDASGDAGAPMGGMGGMGGMGMM